METVDDFTIIPIFFKILFSLVKYFNFFKEGLDKWLFDGLMDENVVNSDASLSAVEEFPEKNTIGCNLYLGSFIYNDWAFST